MNTIQNPPRTQTPVTPSSVSFVSKAPSQAVAKGGDESPEIARDRAAQEIAHSPRAARRSRESPQRRVALRRLETAVRDGGLQTSTLISQDSMVRIELAQMKPDELVAYMDSRGLDGDAVATRVQESIDVAVRNGTRNAVLGRIDARVATLRGNLQQLDRALQDATGQERQSIETVMEAMRDGIDGAGRLRQRFAGNQVAASEVPAAMDEAVAGLGRIHENDTFLDRATPEVRAPLVSEENLELAREIYDTINHIKDAIEIAGVALMEGLGAALLVAAPIAAMAGVGYAADRVIEEGAEQRARDLRTANALFQ